MSISSLSLICVGIELEAVGPVETVEVKDELKLSATADTVDEVTGALSDK